MKRLVVLALAVGLSLFSLGCDQGSVDADGDQDRPPPGGKRSLDADDPNYEPPAGTMGALTKAFTRAVSTAIEEASKKQEVER